MDEHCPNCFGPASTPCPRCGWRPGFDNPSPALALGTLLDGRYRLGRVLGHGGFGITYLAWDENLQLKLAIKEFLPRNSATRAPDRVSLAVYPPPADEQFAYGLERFLEEARALARFDQHPAIVSVKTFFRANGTGYCVMDYVEGLTFKQYLARQPEGRISFEQAFRLLLPVMEALRVVHKEGLLHRDVTPDNIYLTRNGRVKLLDFGAARFALSERSHSLSVILKPGYAPEEQYRARGQQGPWTDIYSLGATLYRAITGQVPPDALDRLAEDTLLTPSQLGVAISPQQEEVLLKAMAVRGPDRFQSIDVMEQAWAKVSALKLKKTAAPPPVADSLPGPVQFDAQFSLGCAAYERSDYQGAIDRWYPLAKQGDRKAQYNIGMMYARGQGFDRDEAQAAQWLQEAARQGDVEAQYNLGLIYAEGRGVEQNYTQAAYWWHEAAKRGEVLAQYNLGAMYADGRGLDQDYVQAAHWWRQAAAQGLAEAQINLGWLYENGLGLAHDDIQAVFWYRQAAEQGLAAAQYNLGMMYALGRGTLQNDAQAALWWRKAAEQGLAEARFSLGLMYEMGRGGPQDEAQAAYWYGQAAEQGLAEAQYRLGLLYAEGRGVERDEFKATHWLVSAVSQGYDEAQNALDRLFKGDARADAGSASAG
ncbi:serine/threonine-protein kinase [Caldichromatium japonicum]|uniref:serine/threonine-protein kinase n=1 Tax=Caldichromatium japonicum TaxID=2699430 RepID=UPI001FE70330|nr:serine/threonine-protein kinase [Caldichromatium japonicum]